MIFYGERVKGKRYKRQWCAFCRRRVTLRKWRERDLTWVRCTRCNTGTYHGSLLAVVREFVLVRNPTAKTRAVTPDDLLF